MFIRKRVSKKCHVCNTSVEQVGESDFPCGVCEGRVKIVDGGRKEAGYKGDTGDCVTRAICIATGLDYTETYAELAKLEQAHHIRKAKTSRKISRKRYHLRNTQRTARKGISKDVYTLFLKQRGWLWKPTMIFGKGATAHLKASELPKGTIITMVSNHAVTMIDGIVHDTYDSTRGGERCVYGYFYKE